MRGIIRSRNSGGPGCKCIIKGKINNGVIRKFYFVGDYRSRLLFPSEYPIKRCTMQQGLRFDRLRAREQTPPIFLLLSLICNTLLHGISLTILRAYIHTCIHTYIHTYIHLCTQECTHYICLPSAAYVTSPPVSWDQPLIDLLHSYPSVETDFFRRPSPRGDQPSVKNGLSHHHNTSANA